ncbi:MAG TPA: hypothetical protein VFV71_04025 [Burkholderiales bacterium]|nr:hypothetical protein [Burkholderiales bacterium]
MKLPIVAILSCLAVCAAAVAQTTVEEARRKWPDLRYLEPGQLRELPEAVRADLEKLGCRIPRFMKWDARHNVIQGQFFKAGQTDWAVLCQSGNRTGILLYPNGKSAELPMLRAEPSDPTRTIHVVSPFVLQKRAVRDHPEVPPPPYDHDGIEDGPMQGTARVLYHAEDDWTEL